jgi:MoaA/NifB/PqqE/SkfB family radical SAM enzyme
MCNRNVRGGLDNPLIKINNWTLNHFKTIMNHEVLDQINSFYFCGNFGDPILNSDLIEMCEYASTYKPSLDIRIHTNGSAHTKEYWERLGKVLPSNHRVIFAIDGLEDTHSIYRIGTNFNKIIENATAFIQAGGQAEWVFIKFKHNEHQVTQAKTMSVKLGFASFKLKNSSRFIGGPSHDVVDKTGKVMYQLEAPSTNVLKFIDKSVIDNYKQIVAQSTIDCVVNKTYEIYIDANMDMFPCCYLGSIPYTYIEDTTGIEVRKEIQSQFNRFVADHGGLEKLNVLTYSIKNILERPIWNTIWDKYWHDDKLITCVRTCGTNDLSKPLDQFVDNEEFNG